MHSNSPNQIDQISQLIVNDAAQDKPVEKQETTEVVETLEAEQTETDKPIDGESESVEAASESEQEGEKSSEEVAEGDEEATESEVDTLNNLAERLEVDVKDLYALNVKLSEGEPQTLGQLKDFFESNQDIESLRENITHKEQALTQQSEDVAKIPEITNDLLQAKANEMAIRQQYERVDWASLRQSDPGQYAALQSDFQTQYSQAQATVEEVKGKVATHTSNQAKFQQDRLFEVVPELKDDAFREKAAVSVRNFASKYGYSDKEIGDITDSRLMHMLIDAARGSDAVETVKEKKVEKSTPKSSKPASIKPVAADASRKAALKRLTDKANNSGQTQDKVAVVSALIS